MKRNLDLDILGSKYLVFFGDREEVKIPKEFLGECHIYSKLISLVDSIDDEPNMTEGDLENRTKEILAHEIFHAYINESGLDLDPEVEEQLANFYQKNWRKMSNSILDIFDRYEELLNKDSKEIKKEFDINFKSC